MMTSDLSAGIMLSCGEAHGGMFLSQIPPNEQPVDVVSYKRNQFHA